MKSCSAFDGNSNNKKHPFKIEKTLNKINKEKKNQTLLNPSYENQFKKKRPIIGDIHR
jgi:hypothetical protein